MLPRTLHNFGTRYSPNKSHGLLVRSPRTFESLESLFSCLLTYTNFDTCRCRRQEAWLSEGHALFLHARSSHEATPILLPWLHDQRNWPRPLQSVRSLVRPRTTKYQHEMERNVLCHNMNFQSHTRKIFNPIRSWVHDHEGYVINLRERRWKRRRKGTKKRKTWWKRGEQEE
jgi:hypothetical protein